MGALINVITTLRTLGNSSDLSKLGDHGNVCKSKWEEVHPLFRKAPTPPHSIGMKMEARGNQPRRAPRASTTRESEPFTVDLSIRSHHRVSISF